MTDKNASARGSRDFSIGVFGNTRKIVLSKGELAKVDNLLGYYFNPECADSQWERDITFDVCKNILSSELALHTAGVLAWAQKIGLKEKADMMVLSVAALAHDCMKEHVPFEQHHLAAAETLKRKLEKAIWVAWPTELVDKIAHCIEAHSWAWVEGSPCPKTPEAQILADTDMLAQLGPTGILKHLKKHAEYGFFPGLEQGKMDLYQAYETIQGKYAKKLAQKRLRQMRALYLEIQNGL